MRALKFLLLGFAAVSTLSLVLTGLALAGSPIMLPLQAGGLELSPNLLVGVAKEGGTLALIFFGWKQLQATEARAAAERAINTEYQKLKDEQLKDSINAMNKSSSISERTQESITKLAGNFDTLSQAIKMLDATSRLQMELLRQVPPLAQAAKNGGTVGA